MILLDSSLPTMPKYWSTAKVTIPSITFSCKRWPNEVEALQADNNNDYESGVKS